MRQCEVSKSGPRLTKPSDDAGPAVIAGWWLHNERHERGTSLAEVARATRIKPDHLTALECGWLEKLPERGRTLDIVWTYADHLKLEPGPLCAHYDRLLLKAPAEQLPKAQTSLFKGTGILARFPFPKISTEQMIGAAFVSAVAFGALSHLVFSESAAVRDGWRSAEKTSIGRSVVAVAPKSATIPARTEWKVELKGGGTQVVDGERPSDELTAFIVRTISESATREPVDVASREAEGMDPKIAVAEERGGHLYGTENRDSRLKIAASSRIQVRIEDRDGNVVLNRTMLSGDAFRVPNRKGLVLIARDGGVLTYELDGKEHGAIGSVGKILVGHPLDPEKIGKAG